MTVNAVLMILLGISVACIGVAWACSIVMHIRVPNDSLTWRTFGRDVQTAYGRLYPRSKLLFWRRITILCGVFAFVAMAAVAVLLAIKAHPG